MIEYPMPGGGAPPDLFKGFRDELANIEKVEKQEQKKALKMASMIEQADQSTMFGGDYAEAQQMAQWMTEHLDDFADSTEGLIEFQQMAQQLNGFIDASEAYKKQNVGTAAAGAAQGTWTGSVQRIAGVDPYEANGFRDTRSREDYEMAYMSLNQERKLQFDEQGKPILSQKGRVENPFMPQLEELEFEGGFEWFESNARGHNFPDGWNDASVWIDRKLQNEDLLRKVVRSHAENEGNQEPLESLMERDESGQFINSGFIDKAKKRFMDAAKDSFDAHSGTPKPDTPKTLMEMEQEIIAGYSDSIDMPSAPQTIIRRIVPGRSEEGFEEETNYEDTVVASGVRPEISQDDLGFSGVSILKNPITSDNYPSLGDDVRVIGFNIDAQARTWVLKEELYDEIIVGVDGSEETIERKRNIFELADEDLVRTLDLHVPSAIRKEYFRRSQINSREARKRKQDERFASASYKATQVDGGAIDSPIGPAENTDEFTSEPKPNPKQFYGFVGPYGYMPYNNGGIINSIRNFFRI